MLVINMGANPLRYSSLGIVRSLGRVGVSVFVISPAHSYPDAISRYAAGRLDWIPQDIRDPDVVAAELAERASTIGVKSVAVNTDDEAAVIVAEHAETLANQLILPAIAPTLPRTLASKHGLSTYCHELKILTPAATFPKSHEDIAELVNQIPFPLVVKNVDPFTRLNRPAVPGTTLVSSKRELLALAATWSDPFEVMLQDYLPWESSEDWFVHAYAASSTDDLKLFTGRKLRSWPPHSGVTSYGVAVNNDELAQTARRLLKAIGYRGPADLDWRRDLRDGGYRLLDFNPRVGAQFRVFQSSEGVDIPRLIHLDLTGRPLPAVREVDSREFIVEYFDVASRLFSLSDKGKADPSRDWSDTKPVSSIWIRHRREFAWFAKDDPLPFVASLIRTVLEIVRMSRSRSQRRRAQQRNPQPNAA